MVKGLYKKLSAHYSGNPGVTKELLEGIAEESKERIHERIDILLGQKFNLVTILSTEEAARLILEIETYKGPLENGYSQRPTQPETTVSNVFEYKENMREYIERRTGIKIPDKTTIPVPFLEAIANKLEI